MAVRTVDGSHTGSVATPPASDSAQAATGFAETIAALQQHVHQLEAENQAMRPIVLPVAEARMCRDPETMIEACPHCSLKRGGAYGYRATHDAACVVSLARALGY